MRVLVPALFFAMASTSCSTPYVERGESLYHDGRYIEAAEMFELTEQRLASSEPSVRAEYGLYRGLTFLRLDDLKDAREWLSYSFTQGRGLLDADERRLLDRGWKELEGRSKAGGDAPAPASRVAETEAQPAQRPPAPGANGRRSVVAE